MIVEEELGRTYLNILLDGEVIGWIRENDAKKISEKLRLMKNPDGEFPFLANLSITLCMFSESSQ